MNKVGAKAYAKRWETVATIERQERRAVSFMEKWRQLDAIKRRAARLDITRENEDGEMKVFLRWARLKEAYVPS